MVSAPCKTFMTIGRHTVQTKDQSNFLALSCSLNRMARLCRLYLLYHVRPNMSTLEKALLLFYCCFIYPLKL